MKISSKKTIWILLPALVLMPLSNAYAADKLETIQARLKQSSVLNCREKLTAEYDQYAADWLTFLQTNFENKSSTSSLSNIAFAQFSVVKSDMEAMLKVYYDQVQGENPAGAGEGEGTEGEEGEEAAVSTNFYTSYLAAYSECQEMTEAYIDRFKQAMMEYMKATSGQKLTTMLVEKYQAINLKLRDLNFQIAQMYGFFKSFADKLPFKVAKPMVGGGG